MAKKTRQRSTNHDIKVYRFGLYGHTGSGKTCLLAALAMDRQPHPEGFTCEWLPEGTGDQGPKVLQEEEAQGRKWLQMSIERLRQHEVPPPNPNTQNPLAFVYDFGAHGRSFRIELFDYSGELIDADVTTSETAARLRERLEEMDAWFVLAPAPFPNEDQKPLASQLHSLQRSFSLLRGGKQEGSQLAMPIALLMNKWDRRSPIEYRAPENENQEMEEFLDSDPPPRHRQLYDSLNNAVLPGYFKAFPVSVFGEHEFIEITDQNGNPQRIERPKEIDPIHPFFLLDPFVWAAQRRDELDVELFEQASGAMQTPISRWLPWPFPVKPTIRKGREIRRRFAKGRDEFRRITQQLTRLYWLRGRRWLNLGIVVVVMFLGTEFVWDRFRYNSIIDTLDNQKATTEELNRIERYTQRYTLAPFYRHSLARLFLMNREEAREKLARLRNRYEEAFWDEIKTIKISNPSKLFETLNDYLQRFPHGAHKEEARQLIASYRDEAEQGEWKTIEVMIQSGSRPDKVLEALQDYLLRFPNGSHAEQARMEIAARVAKMDEKELLARVDRLIENGALREAATALAGRRLTPSIESARQRFLAAAPKKLEERVQDYLDDEDWSEAVTVINEVDLWPDFTQTIQPEATDLLAQVHRRWDQALYEKAIEDKTSDALNRYLQDAPLTVMRTEVETYLNYLSQIEGILDFSLVLQGIQWGEKTQGIDKLVGNISRFPLDLALEPQSEQTEAIDLRFPFKKRLDDPISINFKLIDEGFLFNDKIEASRNIRATVNRLRYYKIFIGDHHIIVSIQGIPKEPNLPRWEA